MKFKEKILALALAAAIIGIAIYFCFYRFDTVFAPEIDMLKKIEDKNVTIEWHQQIGILDQDFPDFITMQKGKIIDTICYARNIANIETYNEELKIGFYGTPKYLHQNFVIRKEIFGYKIMIDTNFTMEED